MSLNKVHIPLERIFNKHIKGIAYPDKEEYRKIVTQYEALEKSFKSGELYDDLKKEIDELKAQNASLERDKKALQETIDSIKVENINDSEETLSMSEQFIDRYFFSEENSKVASLILDTLVNKIRGDKFEPSKIKSMLATKQTVNLDRIKEVLNSWAENGLLEKNISWGADEPTYKLTQDGIKVLSHSKD